MTILTVFRSRINHDVTAEYETIAVEMSALAREMPGFIEEKTFSSTDGERVTVVLFADHASHEAWRNHPRHLVAQSAGREHLYAEYQVYSGEVDYMRSFRADALS